MGIKRNPELVPLLIREGHRLEADILLNTIGNMLQRDDFIIEVSATTNWSDNFVPFEFIREHLKGIRLVRKETDKSLKCTCSHGALRIRCSGHSYKVPIIEGSAQLNAFELWFERSA